MLKKELERRIFSAMKGIWTVVQGMAPRRMEESVFSEVDIKIYHFEYKKLHDWNDQSGRIWAIWKNVADEKVAAFIDFYTEKSGNRVLLNLHLDEVQFTYHEDEGDISHYVRKKDVNYRWTTYKETRK